MTRRLRFVAVLAMALLALTARGGFAAAGSAADDVRAIALEGVPPAVANDRRCEAAFYAAELFVSRGDAGTARPIIVEALGTCFAHDAEHGAVAVELRRLAARP